MVSGIMRSAGAQQPEPAEMLSLLNDSLQERHVAAQYVAMLYAVWNDAERVLRIANAGAVQPLFCHAGQVDTIYDRGRRVSSGHVPCGDLRRNCAPGRARGHAGVLQRWGGRRPEPGGRDVRQRAAGGSPAG